MFLAVYWIECRKAAWNSSTIIVGFSKIWPTSKIGRCFLEILLFSFNYSEIGLLLTCELLGKNTKEIEKNWKDFPALCSQQWTKGRNNGRVGATLKLNFEFDISLFYRIFTDYYSVDVPLSFALQKTRFGQLFSFFSLIQN